MNARRIVSALALLLTSWSAGAQGTLQIHHIDVDQGDATLVVTPNGRTMLIDAGLDSKGDEVAVFLRDQGITNLDAFVLTHYDADHYGGVDQVVAEGITVSAWYDRGEKQFLPADKRGQNEFVEYEGAALDPTRLMPEMTIDLDERVTIVVVASNGHVRGAIGKYPIDNLDENGYSVALLINFGGFNYFVGGDLTQPIEQRLVSEAAVGDLDVYKVSHHGSGTSSSVELLEAIRPEVAIISNGSHGGFNHPRQAVLDNLRQIPEIDIYQTNRLQDEDLDNRGVIVGGNVGGSFIANPESVDSDGTITIEVGANIYQVILPAHSMSRSYPIN